MPNAKPDLITDEEVRAFFGGSKPIDRSTLHRGIQAGRYPRGIKVGPRAVRWVRVECEAVLAAMIAARDARDAARAQRVDAPTRQTQAA